MANKHIRMTAFKQILQLRAQEVGIKTIARQLGLSKNTVKKYLRFIEESRYNFQQLLSWPEAELMALLQASSKETEDRYAHFISLLPYLEKELQKVGVTRWLLWQEYKQQYPQGYNYTQFCFHIQQWLQRHQVTMHQQQKAGDKLYVDYAGKKLEVVEAQTGEITPVEVFIAVLGASQYTYVEATLSQNKQDFLKALENALQFFGGVPKAIVPDNLKAAVTKSSRYEPHLNETLEDFAHHYSTVILPTRSYKPKDKSLVERAVNLVYQRIYARLRHEVFFSLASLNQAIKEALLYHNTTCFQGRDYSRKDLFEEVDQTALQPLPAHRYELKSYAVVTVLKNHHIFLKEDSHYYSVPYRYVSQKVKIIYNSTWVEVYYKHERIAAHPRDQRKYQYSTIKEHMPSAHRFVSEWHPEKFLSWGASIGEPVRQYIAKVLEAKAHPEQGYKSCIGILSLEKKVGKDRLIAACERGLHYQSYSYSVIKNILHKQLDQIEEPPAKQLQYTLPLHDNIRGKDYYQ